MKYSRLALLLMLSAAAVSAQQATSPAAVPPAAPATLTVTVTNPLNVARSSETIVLNGPELQQKLGIDDLRKVHVRAEGAAQGLVTQAVDLNDDGKYDELLFQTDIGPNQSRKFLLQAGGVQIHKAEDFRAYGRFVQERRDDFAWENDRIAHRMYGKALETWAREPLTSSSVDVWTKRTRRLVINDWYMVDDYHHDNGDGGDFYSAGPTRGCGGTGLWVNGTLYPSANFRQSKVLANGPIRVMFELTYDAWDAGGIKVSEVKRVTLDAGQNFDRFESRYTVEGGPRELVHAVGLRKKPGTLSATSAPQGILSTWETLKDYKVEMGQLGMAVVVDPSQLAAFAEDTRNFLATMKVPSNRPVVYYAGFGWSKSGDFPAKEDWDRYVAQFSERLRSTLQVKVTGQ